MNEQMYQWFEERIGTCEAAEAALLADNRNDEAVFQKIRRNVFDIFRTVCVAGAKAVGDDAGKQLIFLKGKLEEISSCWKRSLEAAQAYGNSEKAHIEQVKLDAVAEIRRMLSEWGEEK